MRRRFAVFGLMAAVAGGAASMAVLPTAATQAASQSATFFVPANDGYGIGECVSSGSSCGQVVADGWCEAQGFARAATFGMSDVTETASIGTAANGARPSIAITCAE